MNLVYTDMKNEVYKYSETKWAIRESKAVMKVVLGMQLL